MTSQKPISFQNFKVDSITFAEPKTEQHGVRIPLSNTLISGVKTSCYGIQKNKNEDNYLCLVPNNPDFEKLIDSIYYHCVRHIYDKREQLGLKFSSLGEVAKYFKNPLFSKDPSKPKRMYSHLNKSTLFDDLSSYDKTLKRMTKTVPASKIVGKVELIPTLSFASLFISTVDGLPRISLQVRTPRAVFVKAIQYTEQYDVSDLLDGEDTAELL